MPTSLHELGLDLTDEQIHELAFKCSFEDTRTIGVFKQLNMKDMEKNLRHGKINDFTFTDHQMIKGRIS